MWLRFADRASFDAWHDARCAELKIPRPGSRGKGDLGKQWTTAWTEPRPAVIDGVPCVLARANDDEPIKGLEVVDVVEAKASIDAPVTFTVGKAPAVWGAKQVFEKPLPPTWRDPTTGIDEPVPVRGAASADLRSH